MHSDTSRPREKPDNYTLQNGSTAHPAGLTGRQVKVCYKIEYKPTSSFPTPLILYLTKTYWISFTNSKPQRWTQCNAVHLPREKFKNTYNGHAAWHHWFCRGLFYVRTVQEVSVVQDARDPEANRPSFSPGEPVCALWTLDTCNIDSSLKFDSTHRVKRKLQAIVQLHNTSVIPVQQVAFH